MVIPLALPRIRTLALAASLSLVTLVGLAGPSAPAVAAEDFPLPGVGPTEDTHPRGVYQYESADVLNGIPEPTQADLGPIGHKNKYTRGTREHLFARWKTYSKKGVTWDKFRARFEKIVFNEPGVLNSVTEPSEQVLKGIGAPGQYTWATRNFMFAHWKLQKEGSSVPDWKTWRTGYVNAFNSKRKGAAFEPLVREEYVEKEGLNPDGHWRFGQRVPRELLPLLSRLRLHKKDRPLDAADFEKLKVILEIKSGKDVDTEEGRKQFEDLMKIAKATGCRLITVFGERPTPGSVKMIKKLAAKHGVRTDVRYFPAIGQKAPPGSLGSTPPPTPGGGGVAQAPTTPPGGPQGGPAGDAAVPDVLAAPGQLPADSPMTEAVESSPDSLQQAIRTGLVQDWHTENLAADGDIPAVTQPDLGGVDFSTLELRYVSDTYHNGSGVEYAFKADKLATGRQSFGGRRAARLASDPFFVWLALPPSAFTVNLNPDEPERIIDEKFGRTDAGRVLLEADLAMKKSVAKFIHPDTAGGRKFWESLRGETKCLQMRQWIVPGTATVRDNGDELYILDAPLQVKMESEVVKAKGVAGANGCPLQDEATTEHNESLYRTTILPQVQNAVNRAPEYADLRRVYASRVAAEWFRKRSTTKHTAYSDVIGKGDISRWASREKWTPREVFDRYVQSYKNGEFKVKHKTTKGGYVYTQTYVYGGVDFTRINQNRLSATAFAEDHPGLVSSARNALHAPSGTGREVWLGGITSSKPLPEAYASPTPATSSPWFYALASLPILGWLAAGGLLLRRRRAAVPTGV
ncbi:hypothetical protein ACGFMM_30765 [Streptomyces sp. NPDC048604]|uniref:hypothetical protein n=1 Tax=Streptomyces sp. NPDC048604 TaxID=3365578 RepID=UPI0037138D70